VLPIVTREWQLEQARALIEKSDVLAFDTETIGSRHGAAMVGYSVATDPDTAFYVPLRHKPRLGLFDERMDNAPIEPALELLFDLLRTPEKTVYVHDMSYDGHVCRNEGLDPDDVVCDVRDTLTSTWLCEPAIPHGLKPQVERRFGHKMATFDQVAKPHMRKGDKKSQAMALVPIAQAAPYAIEDALWTLRLGIDTDKELMELGDRMCFIYESLENPLWRVVEAMQNHGMLVDREHLYALDDEFAKEMTEVEASIQEIISHRPKLSSTQWLSRTLIEDLELLSPDPSRGRGKSGFYSMDAKALKRWAKGKVDSTPEGMEVVKYILTYRGYETLRKTFTRPLANKASADGRIHCSFNQTGTKTGRFSSSGPNLQNIPVRSDNGRRIREAFVHPEGWHFVDVDYSQIELRLLAHFSQDPTLMSAYLSTPELDVHQQTADQLGISRDDGKTMNFGILYGMGPHSLAEALGISVEKAREFLALYMARLPGVSDLIESCKQFARQYGYTTTLIGRRRYLPTINSRDYKEAGYAERISVNTKIQGSAADLIKIGMRNIVERLKREGWYRRDVHMTCQVHDELGFEIRGEVLGPACKAIVEELESVVTLTVPLRADLKHASCWALAH